jgi:fructose-specific phosphotransferase system IIC component
MVSSKKSDSRIILMITFFLKPLKRYLVIHSEKVFLISLGLLAILGYVVLFWLMGFIWNSLTKNWDSLVTTTIQLAKNLSIFPTLATLVVGIAILFFLINLIRSFWQLFQAFWDSLEVD